VSGFLAVTLLLAAPLLLVLLGVADLHHALERQKAVDCRR